MSVLLGVLCASVVSFTDEKYPPQKPRTLRDSRENLLLVANLKLNFSIVIFVVHRMFCPRCGKAEQLAETFCRQCGLFLPDLSKPVKRESPPEEHLKANTVLSLLTITTCFTLAFLLYLILGFRPWTHPLIYVTAGLLLGMGGWHIQSFIRTQKLKLQWKRRTPLTEIKVPDTHSFHSASTAKLLDHADFENAVPASVTENTTRHLAEKPEARRSTNSHESI